MKTNEIEINGKKAEFVDVGKVSDLGGVIDFLRNQTGKNWRLPFDIELEEINRVAPELLVDVFYETYSKGECGFVFQIYNPKKSISEIVGKDANALHAQENLWNNFREKYGCSEEIRTNLISQDGDQEGHLKNFSSLGNGLVTDVRKYVFRNVCGKCELKQKCTDYRYRGLKDLYLEEEN